MVKKIIIETPKSRILCSVEDGRGICKIYKTDLFIVNEREATSLGLTPEKEMRINRIEFKGKGMLFSDPSDTLYIRESKKSKLNVLSFDGERWSYNPT
ncbi:MAG: hypothetical protein ACTSW1_00585 [Candidatus Hodarchaeales archaeon]